MANKSKEEQQKELEEKRKELEEKRKLRDKQIAQLKASNEMLEDAKKTVIEHYGEDSDTAKSILKNIDIAKDQNVKRGETFLGTNKYEIDNIEYNEVNPNEVEAYNRRLKNKGLTDEQIRNKNISNEISVLIDDEEKPKSKMEELMGKLSKLNKKTVEVEANVIEKPMTNSEFETLQKKYEEDEKSFLSEDNIEYKQTKIVSIDDINPSIVNDIETQKSVDGFDPRDIPSYVQYDIIPLPSGGECYAHKKSSIPVRYLTASDENLLSSPNLYNNGSLMDVILERTILDKKIRVSDLCGGDRDAIIIWLRATAYGKDYPVIANNGKFEFQSTVDLSKLKYKEFKLHGDENGYFDYETGNGDKLKFKVTSHKEDLELIEFMKRMYNETNSIDIIQYTDKIMECVSGLDASVEDVTAVEEMIKGIKEWCKNLSETKNITKDGVYSTTVTNRMIQFTVSVNGNTDREYIKNYIENMRALEARKYREYIFDNVPGVDLKVNLKIPESQGGGSFETFLTVGETFFLY